MERTATEGRKAINRAVVAAVEVDAAIVVAMKVVRMNRQGILRGLPLDMQMKKGHRLEISVNRSRAASETGRRRARFRNEFRPRHRFPARHRRRLSNRLRWCGPARPINIWFQMSQSRRNPRRGHGLTAIWMRFRTITTDDGRIP
jgi:hypothetical protein